MSLFFGFESATCLSVTKDVVRLWLSFLTSSGLDMIGAEVVVGVEGAGSNEEEVELEGDGSMDEVESIHTAESRDEVELFRLALRAFIQGCCRHLAAVSLFLRVCVGGGGRGSVNQQSLCYRMKREAIEAVISRYTISQT